MDKKYFFISLVRVFKIDFSISSKKSFQMILIKIILVRIK